MKSRATAIAAVLVLGLVDSAAAQSASPSSASADRNRTVQAQAAPTVDVSRLPIDLRRIERSFRAASIREQRDGLNLQYFVDVYGRAPRLVLLTPEDNLQFGPVPYGAPTHRDILFMLTPQEHRGSLYALPLFRLPIKSKDR